MEGLFILEYSISPIINKKTTRLAKGNSNLNNHHDSWLDRIYVSLISLILTVFIHDERLHYHLLYSALFTHCRVINNYANIYVIFVSEVCTIALETLS